MAQGGGEAMKSTERAEKIALVRGSRHDKNFKEYVAIIAAQIEEACAEAIKQERDTHWQDWEQVKKEIWNAAREKAKGIAETWAINKMIRGENVAYVSQGIASRIGKMEPDR